MKKDEFLKELRVKLKYLPAADREDAIRFYDEYISEMDLEEGEDVTARLGTPKEAAADIISECTQKHIDKSHEQKSVKGSATTIWLIILGILSLPLSIPLAIVLFTVILVIVIVIVVMLIVAFAGAIAIPWSFFVPGGAQKLYTLGYGFISLGGGILIAYALAMGLAKIFKSITSKRSARKLVNE